MIRTIAQIALLVNDYDEAIDFYTRKLHFNLVEDTRLSDTKRWVLVAPSDPSGCFVCYLQKPRAKSKKAGLVTKPEGVFSSF